MARSTQIPRVLDRELSVGMCYKTNTAVKHTASTKHKPHVADISSMDTKPTYASSARNAGGCSEFSAKCARPLSGTSLVDMRARKSVVSGCSDFITCRQNLSKTRYLSQTLTFRRQGQACEKTEACLYAYYTRRRIFEKIIEQSPYNIC